MKKKITALILVVPLIFMFTVFSAGQAAAITVPVSVNNVVIDNKPKGDVLQIDMGDYDPFVIKVDIQPASASNQKFTITSSDETVATVDENNKIVPHNVGSATFTVTTDDGGYTDSMMVVITSSIVLDYNLYLQDEMHNDIPLEKVSDKDYDYQVTSGIISTGKYYLSQQVFPTTITSYMADYSSTDENVASISQIGEVVVRSSGEAVVSCEIDGIKRSIFIQTQTLQTASGIVVEGQDNVRLLVDKEELSATYLVEAKGSSQPAYTVLPGEDRLANVVFSQMQNARSNSSLWKMTLTFVSGEKEGVLPITLNIGQENYDLTIEFADASVVVMRSDTRAEATDEILAKNTEYTFFASIQPFSGNLQYTYQWSSIFKGFIGMDESPDGSSLTVSSTMALENVEIILTVLNGSRFVEEKAFKISFIDFCDSVYFEESAATYGLSNELAIGEVGYDKGGYEFKVKTAGAADVTTENFIVTTSSNVLATIDNKTNRLKVTNVFANGDAHVTLTWKYGEKLGKNIFSTYNFFAVKDGVYVDTSDELIAAVKAGNQVVLGGNIMLGEGMTTQQLKAFPTSMPTTADWTYHKNTGASHPKVSHLLDFKNNLYGNGYSINANKFTTGLFERLGDPFTGPLDFINLMNYAKVKGQDHAAYIVTKDGVEIKNVYLLGCSDESLVENDAINLSLLNNVGTVLELMADCNVQDCRVRNGRTGIRAFGRQISENESPIIQTEAGIYGVTSRRMNVTVDGCILSQAREFLLKVGSNAALDGNDDNLAPSLKKQNGMAYAVPGQNSNILGEDGDYFYNTYVMTDITVKDTIFRDSGLFCIGVESHFAGPFLDNATKGMNVGGIDIQGVLAGAGWDNLASTSLPALIRLEGNVQFHDWKVLDNIDSSSLIEIGDNIQEQLAFLNLQINEMVRKASEVGGYKDLMITKTDAETNTGKQYVHGGICFYGGGKNYSEVIYSDNYTAEKLVDYTINLSMLAKGEQPGSALYQQGTYLPYAAGFESFRFMMFDANSDFDLDKQWQISGQQ